MPVLPGPDHGAQDRIAKLNRWILWLAIALVAITAALAIVTWRLR